MSWLFIDSSAPKNFRLGLLGPTVKLWEHTARSNELLAQLNKRVPKRVLMNTDGICVVSGPGSFTAIRTGVLIANLLARLLNKPLVGIPISEAHDLVQLSAQLATHHFPLASYVKPEYDTEPNITLPKTA